MARVEKTISVNAPAEKVFAYLADLTRHSEWANNPLKVEQTSEGAVRQGATFTSVGKQFGRENEDQLTVTEFVVNEKIAFESQGSAGKIRHDFTLKQENGTTTLTKGLQPIQPAGMFKLIMPIVLTFISPGGLDGDLERIKEKLEQA